MSLEDCLPPDLRGPTTTITRVGAGLSGAGVYRVEAAGQPFALKIAVDSEPFAAWRRRIDIQQLASDAGLAPRIVHVDEARRAVLSVFVGGQSFPALYGDPRTREVAIELLGRTVRRVHDLALPPDAEARDPRELLVTIWSRLAGFPVPGFVGDAVRRVLAEEPPTRERAPVLSHNDVNPTNLAYDGEHLMLVDWDTAGPNDPFYDLAAISVFLRMDEETCRKLLAAHDGQPVSAIPAGLAYRRRLVAALCGAVFLHLAHHGGHAGAAGGEALESAPSLADFYQRLWSGSLSVGSAEGQWWFGLALLKESFAL